MRDLVVFRHGIEAWNFAEAASAADRLMPIVIQQRRWMTADELRDGMVMANLHVGNVTAARQALRVLAPYGTRGPGDLRSRLLGAYVGTAERALASAR